MKPPVNDIDRQAAEWAVETDDENFSAERQAALDEWLKADTRHFGAYINARAALARIERLAAKISKPRGGKQVSSIDAIRPIKRRLILTGSLAATFAAIVFAGAAWQLSLYDANYETSVGQTRIAALPDGSAMTLNTATRADVHYNAIERDIVLEHGEALFDVAKNKLRPFVIRINDVKVRAVGTSFSVEAYGDQTPRITVREGVVQITVPGAASIPVRAGSRATVLPRGRLVLETLTARQVEQDLAWRSGHIFFRHETLAAAVRRLRRYSDMHIVIDNPAVATQTVTGMFLATDPATFAHAVAASLNLNTEENKSEIRLTRK
ncbi:MAG: FecR domain-containing protein [Rhizomicrobium sp.]|nr:FecR domain-containing protein [Rhizomicrobium sp.]